MKVSTAILAATLAADVLAAAPKDLDVNDLDSVKDVTSTIASHLMSYYTANSTSDRNVGELPKPYYWWQAGAMWGSMLDYFYYTGDASYNDVITAALSDPSNTGSDFDYTPAEHSDGMGNDDVFYWAAAALSAAEHGFPQPDEDVPSWLKMSGNAFKRLADQWDEKACGGGMPWQRTENIHTPYKNTASNGGFFQLAARLARATDDDGGKYVEWAERAWDWTVDAGLMTKDYAVYDGASVDNCANINKLQWTHTSGTYLYGAAVMANYTGDDKWAQRATGLLEATKIFYTSSSDDGEGGILFELPCEKVQTCTVDAKVYKGLHARYLWHSTHMLPALATDIRDALTASAEMVASTCTGGDSGEECGFEWYTGKHDGTVGLSQQMSSLETVQGLLIGETSPPLGADKIGGGGSGGDDGERDADDPEEKDGNSAAMSVGVGSGWRVAGLAAGVSLVSAHFLW